MASAAHTLTNIDETTTVFSLVGATASGAVYKNTARELSLPQTMEFQIKIGNPGAKGNDHLIHKIQDTVRNTTTGLSYTGSITIDVSVPRDSAWTNSMTENLLAQVASMWYVDTEVEKFADGIVP